MGGAPGIEMVAPVGVTDRGVLWRASRRRPNDRIVRVLEPRFADGAFRQAVGGLRQRQLAGMLEITGHDWTADGHYYIEYAVDDGWRTLAERLVELADWQDRVAVLARVCSLFSRWQRSPVHPLGLSLHDIVLVSEEEHWLPWLVPCPAITLSTPCDLFSVDTVSVAVLAPEVVRGLQPDNKAIDSYALGTLVAQALGENDLLPAPADEDRVEAQARGVLCGSLTAGTRLPGTLRDLWVGEDLFRAVEHHRQTVPSARPAGAEELRSALAALANPVSIARRLRHDDPDKALEVLGWARAQDEETLVDACLLAAEIAEERHDHRAALDHLGRAVASAPRRFDLRLRRHQAAWRVFESQAQDNGDQQLGEMILNDIDVLEQLVPEDDDTAWHQRAAEVYLRRGDPSTAAQRLFTALERDPGDLPSLELYCRCWRELGNDVNVTQTITEARRRIGRLVDAQIITTGDAQLWYERFAHFLS